MRCLSLVIYCMLLSLASASAFDNLEADIYYDGPLKEQIAAEYAVILEGLKKQADGYGVQVRQKDISDAKKHFVTKAVLMTRCLDKGISIQKQTTKKIDLKKYQEAC